jgi:hypothetical protein
MTISIQSFDRADSSRVLVITQMEVFFLAAKQIEPGDFVHTYHVLVLVNNHIERYTFGGRTV